MKEYSVTLRERLRSTDKIILICVIGMSALSIITILGGYVAGGCSKFTYSRVFTQAFSVILGMVFMFFLSYLDYDDLISKFDKGIFVFIIGFLIILVLFGKGEMGNKNWLVIPILPFNIQPSEFCKPLFVITFSRHISLLKKSINHPLSLLQLAVHAGLVLGLLFFTKDLGTVLVYCGMIAFMLFVSGLSVWYFIGAAGALVALFPVIWDLLDVYQQERIKCGFNPELDPIKYGYQALKSKAAIASGGFFGCGFAGGTVYKTLPACQSDFLYSVLAEKFGLLGCLFFMVLMATLIIRILYIARKARKDYAATICVGIAAMFLLQTIENIGMCLAFLPVIGITLPFFSYGGSSVLSSFISVGIVLSIFSHKKKYYFEHDDS